MCITQDRDPRSELVKAAAWLLALGNKLEIDLERSIIKRYPGICPYCVESTCRCTTKSKRPVNGLPAYKIPEELFYKSEIMLREQGKNFTEIVRVLKSIYPGNQSTWDTIGGWKLSAKMQEDLAEVHEAARRHLNSKKPIEAVTKEFADLFAWFLSAWELSTSAGSFDDAFISYFVHGCPVCGRAEDCNCVNFEDSGVQLVEPNHVDQLRTIFEEFAKAVGMADSERDAVIRSLATASETQSEPVAVSAVGETKAAVTKFENNLDNSAKTSKNIATLTSAMRTIWENFGFFG